MSAHVFLCGPPLEAPHACIVQLYVHWVMRYHSTEFCYASQTLSSLAFQTLSVHHRQELVGSILIGLIRSQIWSRRTLSTSRRSLINKANYQIDSPCTPLKVFHTTLSLSSRIWQRRTIKKSKHQNPQGPLFISSVVDHRNQRSIICTIKNLHH